MVSSKNYDYAPSLDGVAIVGMACIFPGSPDLKAFWQNIVNKADAVDDPPEDWGGDFSYDPDSKDSDRIYCKRGGYLGDLARFDPLEYGIMPKAVDGSEPEHFLALRVAHEALKDAGFPEIPITKSRTQVILGRSTYANRGLMNLNQHGFFIHQIISLLKEIHPDYSDEMINKLKMKLSQQLPPFDAQTAPGTVSSIMSGRIANRLDLMGSNYCLDAACASSLIAVERGIQDLHMGKCDAVIAGGVQLALNNLVLMIFTQMGALSRNGQIRPFDKDADGTLLGEGVGMIVLKRLRDAERDGNRIYALIKGVGSASDGRSKSIVAPRVEGEELAIRRAFEMAGIYPNTIQLIEAHGTSMPLGDLTEFQALNNVFDTQNGNSPPCAVGSVKSMIGHLIPAAGIAGLIKSTLALYHKILPPTLHCDKPIPQLEIEKTHFYINTETRPWIHGASAAPRRAGVNAFGFGGINAHVILEEHTGDDGLVREHYHCNWETELCVFSGESLQDMIENGERIHAFLAASPNASLKDLAFMLNSNIKNKDVRLAIVASSLEQLAHKLGHALKRLQEPVCLQIMDKSGIFFFKDSPAKEGKLAFLFPGEGSQYVNMLSDLCLHFPEVRNCFDVADRAFIDDESNPLLSEFVFPPPTGQTEADAKKLEELLWKMEGGVQAVTTANRAMLHLLSKMEIEPQAVLGHSSGEFTALEASGTVRLDREEDLLQYILEGKKTVREVAAAAENLPEEVLVAAGAEDRSAVYRIVEASNGRLRVCMDNCPHQIIICGEQPHAERGIREFKAAGVSCTVLPFGRPYHTSSFKVACRPLKHFFTKLEIRQPRTMMYSCATAGPFPSSPESVRQLAIGQWSRPVLFQQTIEAMYKKGFRIFLEVGPRGNLTAFVNDILKKRPHLAVSTNVHYRSGITQLHFALGMLAACGFNMNLDILYARRLPRRLQLEASADTSADVDTTNIPSPLTLALPILSLNNNDVEELKGLSSLANKPADQKSEQFLITGQQQEARLAAVDSSANPAAQSKSGGGQEPLEKDIFASSNADHHKIQMLKEHFLTMRQFLQSQEQVMKAYLDSFKQSGYSENVHENKIGTVNIQSGNIPHKTCGPMGELPFIGSIIREIPGQMLVIRRELDIDTDVFLKHHTLGGKVSMIDEKLTPLPVMPLSMSMEVLAEAAVRLLPGKFMTRMKNVRANRWIVIDNKRLGLDIVARRFGRDQVHVLIREVESDKSSPGLPFIEGTMIFADAYDQPPYAGSFPLNHPKPSRFVLGNLYTTGMFSGPSFQAVLSIDTRGQDGLIATLKTPNRDRLFSFNSSPQFVIDPILLDGAGQLLAHWNAEASAKGFNLFPYKVDALHLYGPSPSTSQEVEGRLRIKPISENQLRAHIDLLEPGGRMLARIIGWEVRSFELPGTFYGMRFGAPPVLGEVWDAPLAFFKKKNCYECRLLRAFSEDLLLGHGKIWLKALAYQVLSASERKVWRQADWTDKYRMHWLLVKTAVKDAVCNLLKKKYDVEFLPADVEIESDASGRITLKGVWEEGDISSPSVSVSLAGNIAVAFAADGSEAIDVGIDIKINRPLQHDAIHMMFHSDELERMAPISDETSWDRALMILCAKKAAAKAIGVDFMSNATNIIFKKFNIDEQTVWFDFTEELVSVRPELSGVQLAAHCKAEKDFVGALAVWSLKQ
jgi:acyl transferase domain-containing protein/phosphopantetheinyl transferase